MSSSGDQDSQATQTKYRTAPEPTPDIPKGIPYIIGNEAAERFSYYGMKGILIVFMTQYLHRMHGSPAGSEMADAEATANVHLFNSAVYFFPFFGALLSDILLGKYRTIISLSMVYCLGHAALAVMGVAGVPVHWLLAGLALIAIGSGGIKPCVSAHVGDQFGRTNGHLLPRVFGWFYFAINTGAFLSTMLTPWLLNWYGPHWAFGVPGVLMAIATFAFWMGRKVFIHVPAGGTESFFGETFSRVGLTAIGKLLIIYVFVAVFWALFDQTGSSWVLQAEDMDRRWLGVTWLASQIQAVNPIMILVFIPLFQFLIYPAINRVFPLTPMRKISMGLFVMVGGFGIAAFAQQMIDAGQRPSIGWQILAYAVLTASEVMVSITCLEFSYTQAPRKMKSVIMALFLMSVSLGNFFTAAVNMFIIVPSGLAPATALVQPLVEDAKGKDLDFEELKSRSTAAQVQVEQSVTGAIIVTIPENGDFESENIIVVEYTASGGREEVRTRANDTLMDALSRIEFHWNENESLPITSEGQELVGDIADPWKNPLQYHLQNTKLFRISSSGPDGIAMTSDDINLKVKRTAKTKAEEAIEADTGDDLFGGLHPEVSWLDQRKADMADENGASEDSSDDEADSAFSSEIVVGGEVLLSGASYFWFFTFVMLGTAVCFLAVAFFYQPREYLQEEEVVEVAEAVDENRT